MRNLSLPSRRPRRELGADAGRACYQDRQQHKRLAPALAPAHVADPQLPSPRPLLFPTPSFTPIPGHGHAAFGMQLAARSSRPKGVPKNGLGQRRQGEQGSGRISVAQAQCLSTNPELVAPDWPD